MPDERIIVLVLDNSVEDQAYQDYFLNSSAQIYDIQVVPSAEEGLRFCQKQWPDLIILNAILPDFSAVPFMDELRILALERPLPPVLMLSGQDSIRQSESLHRLNQQLVQKTRSEQRLRQQTQEQNQLNRPLA